MAKTKQKKPSSRAATKRAAAHKKASRAAQKGWETRRANERKRAAAARKAWRTRKAIKAKPKGRPPKKPTKVMFLVTLTFQTRRRRGEPPTKFKRDLLIPAPPGSSFRDLKKIARDTLPPEALPLLKHFKKKSVTIAPGPRTRAKKAVDR